MCRPSFIGPWRRSWSALSDADELSLQLGSMPPLPTHAGENFLLKRGSDACRAVPQPALRGGGPGGDPDERRRRRSDGDSGAGGPHAHHLPHRHRDPNHHPQQGVFWKCSRFGHLDSHHRPQRGAPHRRSCSRVQIFLLSSLSLLCCKSSQETVSFSTVLQSDPLLLNRHTQ